MIKAFSPGHVTCFFQPVRTDDVLSTGSRGVGIKLSLGTTVELEERSDGKVIIVMDGKESECPVTRNVISSLCPDRGFDIQITNDLPVGQGFGMSASGALATAIAVAKISGKTKKQAFEAAHASEVLMHGGLGDVSAIVCDSDIPMRLKPGIKGTTVDTGLKTKLNLVVLGDTLSTKSVLTDEKTSVRIETKGKELVDVFSKRPNMNDLFLFSRQFSFYTKLETFEISSFLSMFGESGMCMLGHSVFTTASKDEILDAVGEVSVYSCASTNEIPKIIRKG